MSSHINEQICGEYNFLGKSITYGDSVASDTIINTTMGDMTVEEAFSIGYRFWNEQSSGKEYSHNSLMKVKTFDPEKGEAYFGNINYIYRHKTRKTKWKLTDSEGNTVIITGDHSIMVERNNSLVQIKPSDLEEGDILITFRD